MITPEAETPKASLRQKNHKKRPFSRRRRRFARYLRLLLVMVCFFLITFLLSALISGNTGLIGGLVQSIATPGMPKLIIRDAQYEHKVSPLSNKSALELSGNLDNSYEENQGVAALNPANPTAAEAQYQSPFQKLLAKIGYQPQTLTVKQAGAQEVSFTKPPDSLNAFAFFNNDSYSFYSLSEINGFLPENDGTYYVLIEAFWKAEKSWQKDRTGMYCFAVKFDRPAVFSVNTESLDPGELLVFYAGYLAAGESVSVQSDLPLNLQFSPYGAKQMIALAPVSYDILPGVYGTVLTAGDSSQAFEITVKDKEFAIQYVTMDPQVVADTRTEATNKEFTDKVDPVLKEHLPELLWRGTAARPVPESRDLTLFGARRYINDDVNSYRHTGLDLDAPAGTEVRAVNDGKVLFAEFLAYTGNTVIIEHGLGLKSWYYHMDEFNVAAGDSVKKNDVIGFSGQTGFAAGPHLHLNLSVGDIFINPATAFNTPLFEDPLP